MRIFFIHKKLIMLGLFVVFATLWQGCNRLKLQLVDASVQKPSNVALYFSMDDKHGNPVPDVTAKEFKIYEDGNLISIYESKQTMLNQEVIIERYTLLLLDMSGSVVDSGQIPIVQDAVAGFLENIEENEKIAIYAFDGRKKIISIAPFGAREAALERKNELLYKYEPKDSSTNLNGAIIEAVAELEKAKNKSKVPLNFGTLVIFTDGTDRAHRATEQDALDAIEENNTKTFVIGLGGEVDKDKMQSFAKDGFVHADNKEAVIESFKKVADKINAQAKRYYLLSYCSPSRALDHQLTIKVKTKDQKGKLEFEFNADDFKPECDPTDAPKFEPPSKDDEKIKTKDSKKVEKNIGNKKFQRDKKVKSNSKVSDKPKNRQKVKAKASVSPPPPSL